MDMQSSPPGIQLPAEPYPGLRPFLPHEAALLFGREKQVREEADELADFLRKVLKRTTLRRKAPSGRSVGPATR